MTDPEATELVRRLRARVVGLDHYSIGGPTTADLLTRAADWIEAHAEDGERLDWLSGNHVPVSRVNDKWFVNFDTSKPYGTMRDAIDEARAAAGREEDA